jgi:hypothetical protein
MLQTGAVQLPAINTRAGQQLPFSVDAYVLAAYLSCCLQHLTLTYVAVRSFTTRVLTKMAGERARSAILGAFVADAATMPLHWIYDRDQLKSIIGDKASTPEFFNPPSCPFYNSEKNPGMLHAL